MFIGVLLLAFAFTSSVYFCVRAAWHSQMDRNKDAFIMFGAAMIQAAWFFALFIKLGMHG